MDKGIQTKTLHIVTRGSNQYKEVLILIDGKNVPIESISQSVDTILLIPYENQMKKQGT